jgi:hypothetical protein
VAKRRSQERRSRAEAHRAGAFKYRLEADKEAEIAEAFKKVKTSFLDEVESFFSEDAVGLAAVVWQRARLNTRPVDRESRKDKVMSICKKVVRSSSNIASANFFRVFWLLSAYDWKNTVESWKPRGRAPESRVRSLVKHLIVRYPVPHFMYSAFTQHDNSNTRWASRLLQPAEERALPAWEADLFCFLARGGSIKGASREGLIPVPMTKKMAHLFLKSRNLRIFEAMRHSQVIALGGDRTLASAIYNCRFFSESHTLNRFEQTSQQSCQEEESFLLSVIQWFCHQTMFDQRQVGPIVDYVIDRRINNRAERYQNRSNDNYNAKPFSITGRSAAALLRGMEEWHNELSFVKKFRKASYEPSGVNNGKWKSNKKSLLDAWTIEEVLTSKDLAKEGRSLSHCVASYAHSIEEGHVSIWSLKLNGMRMVTIELSNSDRRVRQCRGKYNRMATDAERDIISLWARKNHLVYK